MTLLKFLGLIYMTSSSGATSEHCNTAPDAHNEDSDALFLLQTTQATQAFPPDTTVCISSWVEGFLASNKLDGNWEPHSPSKICTVCVRACKEDVDALLSSDMSENLDNHLRGIPLPHPNSRAALREDSALGGCLLGCLRFHKDITSSSLVSGRRIR